MTSKKIWAILLKEIVEKNLLENEKQKKIRLFY